MKLSRGRFRRQCVELYSAVSTRIDPAHIVTDTECRTHREQERYLETVLDICNWNKARAARLYRSGWRNPKRIWKLLTALQELKRFEEDKGKRRPIGQEHGAAKNRRSWTEKRKAEAADVGYSTQPTQLVLATRMSGKANMSDFSGMDQQNDDGRGPEQLGP